ncbi:hypothetical protein ACTGYQ_02365 [Streptococcus suis]
MKKIAKKLRAVVLHIKKLEHNPAFFTALLEETFLFFINRRVFSTPTKRRDSTELSPQAYRWLSHLCRSLL